MRRLPAALLAAALLAVGCGGHNATISGKVIYKGRPVTSGAVVVLNPDGTAAKGAIRPDGTYAVSGVARGVVKLGVLSADPAPASKAKPAGWFPLPKALGSPGRSGLTCEVSSSQVSHDIDVK